MEQNPFVMSGMVAEIDFQPYLHSISDHYAQWWQLYTLTDAHTKAQQEPSPFDFGLMVQTMGGERSPNPNGPEGQDKEKIERFPVLEGIRKYVKEHPQVLLVGRPGSGKSTTLARLLLEEARAGQYIPVLVELRFLSNSTILDRIQAFFQRHGLQLDRTQIEDLLFHRRLLLLMDGLNELPSEAARLDVMKFRQDYPQVSMIFTTRDLSLGGDFGLERKLEMQPLTEAQMQAFVRSYVPEQAEVMLRQLKERLREFGQTPLLLWMLCEVFQQAPDNQLPSNLAEVFRAFTKMYEISSVRKHEVAVLKGDVRPLSDRRLWKDALKALASAMMQGETPVDFRVAIHRDEAERELNKIFAKEMFPIRDILDDLLKYHLLQNRSSDQIEFRHQLLQEYYAAEALLEQLPTLDDERLKQTYLNFLKWTEPLALMLALVEDQMQAERVVRLAIEVDLILAARLAGEVKPAFQGQTVSLIEALEVPDCLKLGLLGETRSESAVPRSLQHFEHSDYDVLRSAVYALGKIGSETAIPGLLQQLEDSDSVVRRSAAEALGKIGSEAAIPGLLQQLESSDYDVRRSAAEALGKIRSEAAIPGLLQRLKHFNSVVRRSAVEALGKIGSEAAIPGLLQQLGDNDSDDVRRSAAEALSKIGSEATISGLLQRLEDSNAVVRWRAAEALGEIGSETAIPGLLQRLEDSDHFVHWSAAKALGKIGSEAAIPELLQRLEDSDSYMREKAAEALGEIGSEAAIPGLLQQLEGSDHFVRKIIAEALGKIGSEAAIPELLQRLEDFDHGVREKAAEALGEIGSEAAISGLLQQLESSDYGVRRSAAEALGKVGSEAAISGLLQQLESSDYGVRRSVAEALVKIGSEAAIPELLQQLESSDHFVHWNVVVAALVKIGSEAAIPELLQQLENSTYSVPRDAAEELVKIGSEAAIPELLQQLESSAYSAPRNAAKELSNIAKKHANEIAPHLPHLLTLIPTNSGQEAHRAIRAIQENCKYYNYEIYQAYLESQKRDPSESQISNHSNIINNNFPNATEVKIFENVHQYHEAPPKDHSS